jgi:Zn-dependent protease
LAFLALCVVVGILGNVMPFAVGGLSLIQQMCLTGVWLNALLAFFNIIPIPPLDGSHIIVHYLPPELAKRYSELARFGFLILLALMVLFREQFFLLLTPAIFVTRIAFDLIEPFILFAATP